MVVSKHLTHFCYHIRLVLHQHLNSHVAYPGIPPEISNHTHGQYQALAIIPSSMVASADIAHMCGLKFQVGCQDRLHVNSDADEALA